MRPFLLSRYPLRSALVNTFYLSIINVFMDQITYFVLAKAPPELLFVLLSSVSNLIGARGHDAFAQAQQGWPAAINLPLPRFRSLFRGHLFLASVP